MAKMFRCDRCGFIGEEAFTLSIKALSGFSLGDDVVEKDLCKVCVKRVKKFLGHKLVEFE